MIVRELKTGFFAHGPPPCSPLVCARETYDGSPVAMPSVGVYDARGRRFMVFIFDTLPEVLPFALTELLILRTEKLLKDRWEKGR